MVRFLLEFLAYMIGLKARASQIRPILIYIDSKQTLPTSGDVRIAADLTLYLTALV